MVLDSKDDGDKVYITHWERGRDAVTASLMVDRVANDYTVEPGIKAATDWVLTMPTKRFHVSRTHIDLPFNGALGNSSSSQVDSYYCELISTGGCYEYGPVDYLDREGNRAENFLFPCSAPTTAICGAAAMLTFFPISGSSTVSHVFQTANVYTVTLNEPWINGWAGYPVTTTRFGPHSTSLVSPSGQTTSIDTQTGTARPGPSATYFGLPIIGFAVQSYSTTGLPGVSANVLSNYGAQFNHKFTRRIEVAP